jgi:hypothetical protein
MESNFEKDVLTCNGKSECKKCAEKIFGVEFKKEYFDWLISNEGKQMKIDLYNDNLKIAIEYRNKKHYNLTNDLDKYNKKIILKQELCEKNGVYLITVPHSVPNYKIKDYIMYYLPENCEKRTKAGVCSVLKYF